MKGILPSKAISLIEQKINFGEPFSRIARIKDIKRIEEK